MNRYTLLVPSLIDQIQPICFYKINYSNWSCIEAIGRFIQILFHDWCFFPSVLKTTKVIPFLRKIQN